MLVLPPFVEDHHLVHSDLLSAIYRLEFPRTVLEDKELLPPGHENRGSLGKDYSYTAPGLKKPIRVTTDPEFYTEHSDSVELWSPGAPVFP